MEQTYISNNEIIFNIEILHENFSTNIRMD